MRPRYLNEHPPQMVGGWGGTNRADPAWCIAHTGQMIDAIQPHEPGHHTLRHPENIHFANVRRMAREEREREKGPKPWKTGSVAKCQVRKNNPVSLSENGVVQKQRETLCRGFMVLECGRGFKLSLRTGEYCCGCLSPVCGDILFAL